VQHLNPDVQQLRASIELLLVDEHTDADFRNFLTRAKELLASYGAPGVQVQAALSGDMIPQLSNAHSMLGFD
jgi:hypothetical protein